LAKVFQTFAGHDPLDSTSLNVPVPDYTAALKRDIQGMKIGVVHRSQLGEGVDPAIGKSLEEAISVLASLGAQIVDIELPHARYWVPTYYVIAPSEASSNLSRYDGAHYGFRDEVSAAEAGSQGPLNATYCRSRDRGFGAEVKRRIMLGTYALSAGYYDAYYLKALKVRRLIRNDFDEAFKQVDLLVGPVTPTPAFRLGDKIDDPLQMYLCDLFTVGANLAGLPALSVPAGMAGHLPLGIQFQGPPLAEEKLLAVGAAFQRVTDWHLRRPKL
jgi:aspartyl-tRNA(Asn)/glutamyl-tRNA(Gln) amidotransferase subunit A